MRRVDLPAKLAEAKNGVSRLRPLECQDLRWRPRPCWCAIVLLVTRPTDLSPQRLTLCCVAQVVCVSRWTFTFLQLALIPDVGLFGAALDACVKSSLDSFSFRLARGFSD